MIKLKNGLQYDDFKNYEIFVNEKEEIISSIIKFDRVKQDRELKELTLKREELSALLKNTLNKNLMFEKNMKYEEVFKEGIEIRMPIDLRYYSILEKYYELIIKILDNRIDYYSKRES